MLKITTFLDIADIKKLCSISNELSLYINKDSLFFSSNEMDLNIVKLYECLVDEKPNEYHMFNYSDNIKINFDATRLIDIRKSNKKSKDDKSDKTLLEITLINEIMSIKVDNITMETEVKVYTGLNKNELINVLKDHNEMFKFPYLDIVNNIPGYSNDGLVNFCNKTASILFNNFIFLEDLKTVNIPSNFALKSRVIKLVKNYEAQAYVEGSRINIKLENDLFLTATLYKPEEINLNRILIERQPKLFELKFNVDDLKQYSLSSKKTEITIDYTKSCFIFLDQGVRMSIKVDNLKLDFDKSNEDEEYIDKIFERLEKTKIPPIVYLTMIKHKEVVIQFTETKVIVKLIKIYGKKLQINTIII